MSDRVILECLVGDVLAKRLVVFENDGLIDLLGITTFGVNAKVSENPIGYFGTGLKYAIAVLLRTGHDITIYRGDEPLRSRYRTNRCYGRNRKRRLPEMVRCQTRS